MLGLIGLIVLACLADLEPTGNKQKRRRQYEDEEDRALDRPRRRRRVDDDEEGYEADDRPRRRQRPDDDADDEAEDRPKRRTSRSEDEELEDEPLPKKEQVRERPPPPVVPDTQLVQCSKCQKKLKIPATLIGKKVKCPACNGVFVAE